MLLYTKHEMTAKTLIRYSLEQVEDFIFRGFDYRIADETMETISNLAMQVGSPSYDRTPVFKKRENFVKPVVEASQPAPAPARRRRGGNAKEVVNDDDWEAIRSFQATKLVQKTGVDADFNLIQSYINKMTDKNYADMRTKIVDTIHKTILEHPEADVGSIGANIFNVASSNRYYSKIYADLYTDLSNTFTFIREKYEENLQLFMNLFDHIDYVDPNENYDGFCEINKINEKRKSLATFYVNLMINGVVSKQEIVTITRNLLAKIHAFLTIENKKNEVEELTETVAILYNKDLYEDPDVEVEPIDGHTVQEVVERIASSKVKDFKSLTNKALFKFMDLVDM